MVPADAVVVNDRVFISYSNHDAAVAETVCAAIERRGRRCWIAPRDIRPSLEWAEQIIDGLNASSIMVMVFSSASNQSPQVRREVERAVNRDIPVVPFRIERVMPVKSLEYFLSTHQWFDAWDGAMDTHVARLCDLVEARLAGERARPTTDGPATTDFTATFAASPPVASTPRFRDDDLAFVARELARQIGPIARYLVERASAAHAEPAPLIDALAAELEDPKERARFVTACRQRFDR